MRITLVVVTIIVGLSLVSCGLVVSTGVSSGKDWDNYTITVENLTKGIYLTPILAVGHSDVDKSVFQYGKVADTELQAVAEGGDFGPLAEEFASEGGFVVTNPAQGLLGPGEEVSFKIPRSNSRITLIAMMLPTNDGFVALDSALLRTGKQYLYAIDAGTEANNEQIIVGSGKPGISGIPADPGGANHESIPSVSTPQDIVIEGIVARHPGIKGFLGSALKPEHHGWEGPIAVITIN